jgi:short-subunit dehydrogenase
MRVTQAILPLFRAQSHGTIGFTSSSTAWAPLHFMSHYVASKAALSTHVESLHKEGRPRDIQCVAFECGGFPAHLGQSRQKGESDFGSGGPTINTYGSLFGKTIGKMMANPMVHMPGDLGKAVARIVDVHRKEGLAARRPWAVCVSLGSDGMGSAKQRSEEQLKLLNA